MTTSICQTFQTLGDETWDRIAAAHLAGMRWSEESNTEHLLLHLRLHHPKEVLIAAFSKAEESSNGADWEWWFTSSGAAYGMRVQAKRIRLPKETFGYLHYKPKGRNQDQMTTLIERARSDGLTPAYCFYVASRQLSRNPVWPANVSAQIQKPSGCLIGHAEQVRHARSNHLHSLTPLLMPWHLLVCPSVADHGGDIAHSAAAAMQGVTKGRLAIGLGIGPPSDPLEKDGPWLAQVHERPPSHVSLFRSDSFSPSTILREARASERGIRGIVLFQGQDT